MMDRSRSKPDIFRHITRDLTDVRSGLIALQNRDQSINWIAATLLNSWVNFSTGSDGNHLAAYSRDSNGIVRLRGVIKTGAIGTVALTLPQGFRPGTSAVNQGIMRIPVVSAGSFGYVTIEYDGDVIIAAGSNTWVDLAGVQFRAEL
jgi:hypothetical protein